MGIKPLLILVVFLLIIGTSFAQYSECGIYAPGTISQDMCNTMHTFRSFLGPSHIGGTVILEIRFPEQILKLDSLAKKFCLLLFARRFVQLSFLSCACLPCYNHRIYLFPTIDADCSFENIHSNLQLFLRKKKIHTTILYFLVT